MSFCLIFFLGWTPQLGQSVDIVRPSSFLVNSREATVEWSIHFGRSYRFFTATFAQRQRKVDYLIFKATVRGHSVLIGIATGHLAIVRIGELKTILT